MLHDMLWLCFKSLCRQSCEPCRFPVLKSHLVSLKQFSFLMALIGHQCPVEFSSEYATRCLLKLEAESPGMVFLNQSLSCTLSLP